MRALILTAGLGTRLRPLTYVRAKAAVPVNGIPLVRRVVDWLVSQGIHDMVLNLHHRPESIAAVIGDGRDAGARVRYSWESPVLGSAGGPRRALPLLVDGGQETFLIVNGDTLTDFPLAGMIDAHRQSGALVTMALIPNPRPDHYGGVLVDGHTVTGFSRRGAVRDSYHFIGIQVAEQRAFADLQDGVPAESVAALYPQLMRASPDAIGAYVVDAPFSDIGTPADYLATSLALAEREGNRLQSGRGIRIDASATVTQTAVWNDVHVGPDARLDRCIVCDGAVVPEGARFTRCAIAPRGAAEPQADDVIHGELLVRSF